MMTWHNNVRSKLDGRTQFIMKIKTGMHRSRSVEVDGPTDRAMAVRRSLWITSSSCAKRFFTFYCGIGMLLADLRMHRILRIVHHDFIIIYKYMIGSDSKAGIGEKMKILSWCYRCILLDHSFRMVPVSHATDK